MKNLISFVLAGGRVEEMSVLTMARSKAAVPFAGMYRIIDFPLTNLSLSDVRHVGILSQYRPSSLMDHVEIGKHWDYDSAGRDLKILPPYQGSRDSDWYRGTADAVYQNIHFIKRYNPKYVLIISGDHIYRMNYSGMLSFHRRKKADLTIAFKPVTITGRCRFGIGELDNDGRVAGYEEKPEQPRSNLASLTIYIFNTEILIEELIENEKTGHTFQIYNEIIPHMIKNRKVYGYIFKNYWEYARTIDSYYQAHMDLLIPKPALSLKGLMTNLENHGIGDAPEAIAGKNAVIKNSIISPGCRIDGTVINSVISPWVKVEKGAEVRNSVIMHNCIIRQGASLDHVITDKFVEIGSGSIIGKDDAYLLEDSSEQNQSRITLIGKKACIPEHSVIGKGRIISPKL